MSYRNSHVQPNDCLFLYPLFCSPVITYGRGEFVKPGDPSRQADQVYARIMLVTMLDDYAPACVDALIDLVAKLPTLASAPSICKMLSGWAARFHLVDDRIVYEAVSEYVGTETRAAKAWASRMTQKGIACTPLLPEFPS